MLSYAAQGLSGIVGKSGNIRLLLGEPLTPEEYAAVRRGVDLRSIEDRIHEKLTAILINADTDLLRKRLQLLSWLVATRRIEIRFCLTDRGMFHEKMGILTDDNGDRIVFHGSANETFSALSPDYNFESIVVYPSWKNNTFQSYASPFIDRFELIWDGYSHHVETITIPSRSYDLLQSYHNSRTPPEVNEPRLASYVLPIKNDDGFPSFPQAIGGQEYNLRPHQKTALREWRANDYRGILAHATGSGKTITALHGATALAKYHKTNNRNFVFIVSVPYQVLADQWCEVMELFGIRPHRCYRGKRYWQTPLRQDIASITIRDHPSFVAIVVVNATLQSKAFQEIINKVHINDLLFVGDECHHHSSVSLLKKLPKSIYQLGLSATPWRSTDLEAQGRLREYYSGVVSTYSIKHALDDGVLVPYQYHVREILLTDEEADEYQTLSEKIAQLVAAKENGAKIDEDYLSHLFRARSRIIGSAEGKFLELERMVESTRHTKHCLIYCGDGSTELNSDSGNLRDVERVAHILHQHGWKSSRFTAEESQRDRSAILVNFRYSYIDAIVAIRVLDEGFDMPQCQSAFLLASSRNERQFIQRRGRILRTSPGKQSATIHDYIVRPPSGHRSVAFRNMVSSELIRALEFARFSTNKVDTIHTIRSMCSDFNLDMDYLEQEVLLMELRIHGTSIE